MTDQPPMQPIQPTSITPVEVQPVSKTVKAEAAPASPGSTSHDEQVAHDVVRALVERKMINLDGVRGPGSVAASAETEPQSRTGLPDLKAEQAKTQQNTDDRGNRGGR